MWIEIIKEQTDKDVPLPSTLCIISSKNKKYTQNQWQVFSQVYQPQTTIASHLVFALKYEGMDLYILKMLFQGVGEELVLELIKEEPTSQYTRKIWFLYEWLMNTKV